MSSLLRFVLIPNLYLALSASAFCIREGTSAPGRRLPHQHAPPTTTKYRRTRTTASELSAELVFRSEVEWISDDDLVVTPEYFQSTAFRDHLLSAGGSRPRPVPVGWTPELRGAWERLLMEERNNDTETIGNNPLLSTKETAAVQEQHLAATTLLSRYATIQFPGLLLNTTMVIAFTAENATCCTARLIHEQQRVTSGAAPLVWLYRQLMEKRSSSSNSTRTNRTESPPTRSTTTISYHAEGVKLQSRLSIRVAMPSVLLKFLPTSPAKMEEQGSASVAKVVERDVRAVADGFPAALETWATQQQQREPSLL